MTEEILEIYRMVARPFLDMAFEPERCVEQSRVLIEVLKRFGIAAEPLGTKFILTCNAKEFAYYSGLDEEEKERGKRTAKAWLDRDEGRPAVKGKRHVVVIVERRILVDPTFYQARAVPFNFTLDPDVLVMPFPHPMEDDFIPDLEIDCNGNDGTKFTMRYIGTRDKDWELDDGWEPSHLWPLIDRIEKEIHVEIQRRVTEHLMEVCFGGKK